MNFLSSEISRGFFRKPREGYAVPDPGAVSRDCPRVVRVPKGTRKKGERVRVQ